MTDVSVIFPAYNEEERIGPTLRSFNNCLSKKGMTYELLVVDDGSTDNTVKFVKDLRSEIPALKILELERNKGKGFAVRKGMLNAIGEIRIFSDADGSTPAEELDKLLEPLINGQADITIGSRYLEHSKIENAQPFMRRWWSRFVNGIVQKILLPGIVDTHCGFKAFTSSAAIKIFSKCKINEWSFDLEVLVLAKNMDMEIVEIPVRWKNDERSKGRLKHMPKEIYNLVKIKRNILKQDG